jgi:hypothetical protein
VARLLHGVPTVDFNNPQDWTTETDHHHGVCVMKEVGGGGGRGGGVAHMANRRDVLSEPGQVT